MQELTVILILCYFEFRNYEVFMSHQLLIAAVMFPSSATATQKRETADIGINKTLNPPLPHWLPLPPPHHAQCFKNWALPFNQH